MPSVSAGKPAELAYLDRSVSAAETNLDADVAAVSAKVTNVDSDVAAVAAQVTNVDGDVAAVAAQVTNVDGDVAAVAAAVANVDGDVAAVAAAVAGRLGSIKAIHRGSISISAAISGTATIPAVDVAKSMVTVLGKTGGDNADARSANVNLTLTNATTLTAASSFAGSWSIGYQVVEFN